MELLLSGGIPDIPPPWELGFQLEKEIFGMPDFHSVCNATYGSEEDRNLAMWSQQAELMERMVERYQWGAVHGGRSVRQIEFVANRFHGSALVCAFDSSSVFYMPSGSEIMDFSIRLYEDQKGLHREARKKVDKAKVYFRDCVNAGADFFMLTNDFGFNNAPFVSPAHFEEFIQPYLTEVVQAIHDLGKKSILHSDGCLNGIQDQIYATGVDGWQSVDPQGHMDIKAVREAYPDWILMGNVACNMLQDTNKEEIRRSVRYCMEHGGIGKPYIFSASNVIYKGMPPESYDIMMDEYSKCIQENVPCTESQKPLL
jgi:uroporphyrinogen decarboxylase